MGDNNESLNDPIKLISLDNLSTYHDLMDAKKEEHSVTLTLAQYNALSPEEKMNGKTYYISDAGSSGMVVTASDVLMTGYSKASSASAITTNDTGSIAFGKLEKGLDDVSSDVDDINGLIPSTATVSNKLATASDIPDVSSFITKAVNDLTYYYTSSNTYTKTEVDNLIAAAKNGRFVVVNSLPTSDIDTKVIYLVPKSTAQTNNVYDEYINTDGTSAGWEKIGDTQIDLTNYVQKSSTSGLIKNDGTIDTNTYATTTALADKVDKVNGKGLSTNDYTTSDMNKLGNIKPNANRMAKSEYTLAYGSWVADLTHLGVYYYTLTLNNPALDQDYPINIYFAEEHSYDDIYYQNGKFNTYKNIYNGDYYSSVGDYPMSLTLYYFDPVSMTAPSTTIKIYVEGVVAVV